MGALREVGQRNRAVVGMNQGSNEGEVSFLASEEEPVDPLTQRLPADTSLGGNVRDGALVHDDPLHKASSAFGSCQMPTHMP